MKTMIDVDDEALMAAARELGTVTKKDTVNAALAFAAARHARVSALLDDPHSYGVGTDIGDAEVMSAARR
jgi:Arc/MetJ family transcription regulator